MLHTDTGLTIESIGECCEGADDLRVPFDLLDL